MKKVFTSTAQCMHAWAQQNQDEGRASSVKFDGTAFYSYATPVANFVTHNNRTACLITTVTYSVTTSGKHMPSALDIPGDITTFRCKHIGISGGISPYLPDNYHNANIDDYNILYNETVKKATRARQNCIWLIREADRIKKEALKYAAFFEVDVNSGYFPTIPEALYNRAENTIKAAEAVEAKLNEVITTRLLDVQAAWLKNEKYECPELNATQREALLSAFRRNDILMRINGNEIETSRGARFPIEDGKKLFGKILYCVQNKKQWLGESGVVVPLNNLGNFKVNKIDCEGNVTAGCHYVKYTQIESIAKQLNILV